MQCTNLLNTGQCERMAEYMVMLALFPVGEWMDPETIGHYPMCVPCTVKWQESQRYYYSYRMAQAWDDTQPAIV